LLLFYKAYAIFKCEIPDEKIEISDVIELLQDTQTHKQGEVGRSVDSLQSAEQLFFTHHNMTRITHELAGSISTKCHSRVSVFYKKLVYFLAKFCSPLLPCGNNV